jgi:hypothetical protein
LIELNPSITARPWVRLPGQQMLPAGSPGRRQVRSLCLPMKVWERRVPAGSPRMRPAPRELGETVFHETKSDDQPQRYGRPPREIPNRSAGWITILRKLFVPRSGDSTRCNTVLGATTRKKQSTSTSALCCSFESCFYSSLVNAILVWSRRFSARLRWRKRLSDRTWNTGPSDHIGSWRRACQREDDSGKQQRVGKVVDPLHLDSDTWCG